VSGADTVGFPATVSGLSGQLAGHKYSRGRRDGLVMDVAAGAGIEIVAELGKGGGIFISCPHGEARLFIWSTVSVFDMELPLSRESEFETAADEYIPAIIFLRSTFGERCWHNPTIYADIVIDDPALTPRYGFIDFPGLLRRAREVGFHVTVAFIPWNHWRTQDVALRGFLDYREYFGICAHGCDHIKNEFRTSDYAELLGRSYLAAERMDRHERRTGMRWEHVMVYPREDYTLDALKALADSGRYLGVVNTACIPRDMETRVVRGADLLSPAQDAFFGFPLFKRHYWSEISVFAMAAFLGKPTILVEHHDFFQDGFRALDEFTAQLGAICPGVQWRGLTDIACKTHAQRRAAGGALEVRFFTDRFEMENPDADARMVRFRRRVPESVVIESVALDGRQISFEREGEFICFEARLDGRGAMAVQVRRGAVEAPPAVARGWSYGAGVAARRLLSEVRDNWLSRSKMALSLANKVMRNGA